MDPPDCMPTRLGKLLEVDCKGPQKAFAEHSNIGAEIGAEVDVEVDVGVDGEVVAGVGPGSRRVYCVLSPRNPSPACLFLLKGGGIVCCGNA